MVSQLETAGEQVANLLIIDTHPPLPDSKIETQPDDEVALLVFIVKQIGLYFNQVINISYEQLVIINEAQRLEHVLQILQHSQLIAPNSGKNLITGLLNVYKANLQATNHYQPQLIKASISLFKTPTLAEQFPQDSTLGWGKLTSGEVYDHTVAGNHESILQEPHVQKLSVAIQEVLQRNNQIEN